MIYIFDKTQAIIKVLTNDDFTAAHLNFKINTATTFEFSLPASKALPSGSKYVATPHPLNDSKFIMLRLTERVDNTETIDYSAYELAYQELATDGYIEDKRPQNQSALNLMKIALDGSNWELNNVNVSGTATTNFYYVDRLSAISKVVDLLGGEIVFYIEIQGNAISGRYMDYLARQGADTSKVFASGSNLLTVERQSDTSNIYTAILPRGKGKEIDNGEVDTPDGYGRRINIADVEWKKSAGKPLDKPKGSIVLSDPDATAEWGQINGNARLLLQTYDDIDDVNVLINSAYKTLQSVNHPQIQYSATVADVGGLSLGDTVLIMHGDRDLSYKTRVFEVKYDLLSPDQTELSLGDDLSSNSITSQINNLNAVADTTSSQTQWTINQIGRPSTTFGNTEPANPKVGDVFFKELPDGGTEIYRWNGDIWELLASPTTADDISTAVDDAVALANAHTDAVKQGLSSDISTAKSQATSQANSALASAKSAATSQFTQAQSALSAAKTDLTNSIASEASARTQAVATVNSQAQTYANQAKSDALNTIAKEVTDRQNAVSALDTKATNAVNQAKSDINDTINAISVGGRNLYITATQVAGYINGKDGTLAVPNSINKEMTSDYIAVLPNTAYTFQAWGSLLSGQNYWAGIGQYDSNKLFLDRSASIYGPTVTTDVPNDYEKRTFTTSANTYFVRVSSRTYGNYRVKFEQGNLPTDWTNAPEDIVLDYTTKDNQIRETITQYKDTNDGKVSKAQTDATTSLGLVATKVSQTDYDQKTGDLSSKYTEVKQTADSQTTDIVDIKATATSQASKINTISSDVDGTKQSISDIKTTQDSQSDKINQITSDVNGTKQSITDIQTKDGKQDTRMGTIETSVSGVKSDFSTYKTDANGRISTAQSTAQTAVDGLKTKVSKTDYNTKIGQLQTDLTSTTQTANQAKTDIVSIKKKDGEQDAKMNTIVSDANGTKQTVSDLQTAQGKQSGDISTLQQRADGFDATVTKVNNLSVGGRNLLLNSKSLWAVSTNSGASYTIEDYDSRTKMWHITAPAGNTAGSTGIYFSQTGRSSTALVSGDKWVMSIDIKGSGYMSRFCSQNSSSTTPSGNMPTDWTRISSSGVMTGTSSAIIIYFNVSTVPLDIYIKLPKLETGTLPTAWSPAPEDLSSATAKAQLTADNASLAVTKLTSSDGIITKAQSDIKANADAITQKVSKTDYDQKTGDLTQAISKAQSTAEGAVSTVGNYQTSNDKRVKAAESTIEQHTEGITARVSQTDYDDYKSTLNTRFTKVEATADGASTTVGELQTDFNGMSYENRNLLENSGFEFPVNNITGTFSVVDGSDTTRPTPFDTKMGLIDNISNQVAKDISGWYPLNTAVTLKANVTYTFSYYFSVAGKAYYQHSDYGIDDSGSAITGIMAEHETPDTTGGQMVWKRYSKTFTLKTDRVLAGLRFGFVSNGDGRGWKVVDNVKLEIGSKATDYSVAPNDTTLSISQVSQKADSISNFVRDSSGNISSNFQTALSKTSIITGSTLATSIKTQTTSQISSAITDNNGKIISLINQDSSGVQIAGKNIVLDGNTTVTGDFYAKGGNFTNLNASNITVGTLNGNQVNITNLNASNIVSGAISGANLNINLNTGQAVFQRGRIYNTNFDTQGGIDINIDEKYISTKDYLGYSTLANGGLYLSQTRLNDPGYKPYFSVGNNNTPFGTLGALLLGTNGVAIATEGNSVPTILGKEAYNGLLVKKGKQTLVAGSSNGVMISGGKEFGNTNPFINVGATDMIAGTGGDRIQVYANYFHLPLQWSTTTSNGANMYISLDGAIVRSSSSSKYKLDIEYEQQAETANRLLTLDPATWHDKFESKQLDKFHEIGVDPERTIDMSNRRYYGIIAEDLVKAGLEHLVSRNVETGEVEGVEYSKIGVALIPIVRDLRNRLNDQNVEIERLKEKIK
ncbi:phage tail spike protein [Leuconostoc gasicomitatum]|uniref:phage tail spike protein n=1 Tax=Leuconostoc gasicomitatum TaxID=115778 RepID=UPI000BD663EC|nr:phage tail spike protein [Leuconostoc gasicomitatum]MBZ5967283.1 phage tail protein [Leuconostoc gasicomitatum]QFS15347.1 hypothetical protein BHS03_06760 [Leuconostoc gasicomitatum]SOB97928.1 Autotransporter adhesin (modular protein) [Leuconostoc gasicomitatum]